MATGSINIDVSKAIKKLREIPGLYNTRTRRALLRKAGQPVLIAAKANISDSDKPHHRYKTAKANSSIKAPKGKGKIVATYEPGNLRRSLDILTFRKSKYKVFVGPRIEKKGASGLYGGGKVDGYYAAMVEYGTVNMSGHASKGFMRKAAVSQSKAAQTILKNELTRVITRWLKKNSKK